VPLARRDRRAAFPRAVAEAGPLDLVAPAGVAGADAAAPQARGVAALELLALGAPVLPGAPLVRGVTAAGLPDWAVASAGAPLDAGAARLELGEAISAVGATPVDREEAIAAAPYERGGEGDWGEGSLGNRRGGTLNSRSEGGTVTANSDRPPRPSPAHPAFMRPYVLARAPNRLPRRRSRATPPG